MFQYGYEVEYLKEKVCHWETPLSLDDSIESDEPWKDLSPKSRLQLLENLYNKSSYGDNLPLFKTEGLSFLAESPFFDDNGNIEVRQGPFDSFDEMISSLENCLDNFGKGSLQATVSIRRSDFFDEKISWLSNFGLAIYLAEFDVLDRIHQGFESFKLQKSKAPLKTFAHPHLGPLNLRRHSWLKEYMQANHQGERFRDKDLLRVGKREQSFKYIGATSYRPDIGGSDRVAFEIRDAHTDLEKLKQRTQRIVEYLRRPRNEFTNYASIAPFDSESAWLKLNSDLRDFLIGVFPNRAHEHIKEFPDPYFMYDVFRNFAYPLRDWSHDFQSVVQFDFEKISKNQQVYVDRLTEISRNTTKTKEAAGLIQIALCEFIVNSEIKLDSL